MAINDPRDIPDLLVWLSAEALTGYADGATITGSWTDLSGNGNHAASSGGSTKPIYQTTTGPAGGPAVRFPSTSGGAGGWFSLPAGLYTGKTSLEVMATIKADNNVSEGSPLSSGTSGNQSHYPYNNGGTGANGTDVYMDWARNTRINYTATVSPVNWHRANIQSSSTAYVHRINETNQYNFNAGSFVANTSATYVGTNGPSSGAFQGHMGCVVIYGRTLTTGERADLAAWLTANPSGGTLSTTAAGSLATETDTALAGSTANTGGSLATETDTALAGETHTGQTGQLATETDTALAGETIEQDIYYAATIKVGAHEFTITSQDTVDEDDPIQVLDALNIGWQAEESDPWPAQPDPVQATIGFYTGDVDNLEDVDINTPISVVLTDALGDVFGTFHGRVAQLDAQPIRRNSGLFTLYTIHGIDYTRDLDELPIVIPLEWPAESGDDRFARIVAAIAAAGGPTVEPPADCDSAAFQAYAAGTTTAGALLRDHLRQVAVPGDFGPERYLLVPVVVTDALDHFECVRLIRTVDAALLPGTLDVVGGLLTLVFPDDEADGLVDAGIVRLEVPWTRLKYRAVNRVTVTGDTLTVEKTRPGVPVRLNLDTTLTDVPAAERMAELYLPDAGETNGWVADTFRLEAWKKPSTITPSWFPDHREDPASTSVYVMPIAVVGIAPEINLAGNQAYAGQLTNVSLTIANRRPVVDFSLRLQLPLGIGADAASWEWLEDEHPTITWEDVDPDLSWYEARLARRS